MAGAKINTKSKGKDDKTKGNKNICSNNEESEDHDFSVLRKPVLTSITGFAQARKIFDFATEELKSLLANECDLLYECKVCRNIFRSLANFISHKRVYCKEKFSSSVHSHFIKSTSAASEMIKIRQMEEAYQESLKLSEATPTESNDRIPLTKDLTGIVEKLAKIKGRYNFDEQQVTLQKIPNSSVAVFQSHSEEKRLDNMQAQVQELDNILSQDQAVLQKDGSFNVQSSLNADKNDLDNDNVIQISDDDDSDDGRVPKCKICDMQFATQKTLRFHMKYKHLESRLVYPCPDCFEIFSTSWSVYRHLFKVHRKSAAQIRRLREAIQAKAFKMNNPPAFYEKRKNMKAAAPQKITEEERLDQENQAWMDNMEGDGELPRCGGCGRTFERRAALAAHTHTCQPRSRALARRPPENKKIEIQIRKDYNKGPPSLNLMPKADTENRTNNEETQTASKVRPEKISEPAENADPNIQKEPLEKVESADKTNESAVKEDEPMETNQEPVEKTAEPSENILEEATMDIIDDKSSDSSESPEKHVAVKQRVDKQPRSSLPFALQIEKSNFTAFKKRMQADVDFEKILCKRCDTKHTRMLALYDHMAEHYKWMRYACKLCNFKHYDFVKVPEHVKIVHKLKGDSDFYFSTVKAIDGAEALELAEPVDVCDVNEESSESRRPSRCSSDSSRLSDDSSSSSVRVETGSRKRKMYHNRASNKRKKDAIINDEAEDIKESDASTDKPMNNAGDIESSSSPNAKIFEENSSDIEELEEKLSKRHISKQISTVASRRPVRKKTKPKNEDFEYDLSNLLKMEAQGYRDSQTVGTTPKATQTKKRLQQELQNNYDNINKENIGALLLMSKKAVDKAAAELKTTNFSAPLFNMQKEQRPPNVFARPMLPKTSRTEKTSPKKDNLEEVKESLSSNKASKIQNASPNKDTKNDKIVTEENTTKLEKDDTTSTKEETNKKECVVKDQSLNTEPNESVKPKLKIPSVVPMKFRRQSLELMKNPIINKNITDFSKAGMKTKILLIKPINRNKDGVSNNTPLKFQTIKLKETNKGLATNEDKPNDQIVVVKVPKVNRTVARTVPDNNVNVKRLKPLAKTESGNEAAQTKYEAEKPTSPVAVDEKNTEKSDVNNASGGSNSEQNDVNNSITVSTLGHSGTPDLVNNNVDKIGCGNEISSKPSEASNVVPEPMDMEELGTSSNILETVCEDTPVSAKSIVSRIKSTSSKSVLSIPELAVKSIIHDPIAHETVNETLNNHVKESCSTVKDAILIRESTNQDSEPNIVTNGDITSS